MSHGGGASANRSRTSAASRATHECDQGIAAELRARGLRPTPARCHLLSYLRGSTQHPSAEEITAALRAEGHAVGVATVYQNLNRLVDSGLVSRMTGVDGRLHFDADVASHGHAVCESCGRIADSALEKHATHAFDWAVAAEAHAPGWLVKGAAIEVRGVCPDCQAA